ncbi:MAG TPA: CBS domain-containing protein, partial [Burkholderiales bacterium]|nr:CBS domain-containing protein [Burkholderiales bacterium]
MDIASSVDLTDEIKARSAAGAAAKLADLPAAGLVSQLVHLSPGFAQDVLDELPSDARERAISGAPADVARQWQRNAMYDRDAIGRMMEPVVAAFDPKHTVGDTIEELRELVTRALITYVYVVDDRGRLLGIVTMRDLLFSERGRTLDEVMLRDAFALRAAMPMKDAMRLVLDKHFPVYPVVDAEQRLVGLVRGQTMFEAQA